MQTKLRSDAFLQQAMVTCGDAVYRLALCRLNSCADAEDVYQEVFLRLLRDGTDFRDTEHLKAWLLRVTLSRCADLRRSAWFKRTAPMEAAADAAAPEPESSSELWQAVHALPDDQRIAVWLHYVEGYRTEHRGDCGNGRLPSGNGTHAAASRKKAIKAGFGGILR